MMEIKQFMLSKGLEVEIEVTSVNYNKDTRLVSLLFTIEKPIPKNNFLVLLYNIDIYIKELLNNQLATYEYKIIYQNRPSDTDYSEYFTTLLELADAKLLGNYEWTFAKGGYTIKVPAETNSIVENIEKARLAFAKYGFIAYFVIELIDTQSIIEEREKQINQNTQNIVNEQILHSQDATRKEAINQKTTYRKPQQAEGTEFKIGDLPITRGDLLEFENLHGEQIRVKITGDIFEKTLNTITSKKTQKEHQILTLKVTDYDDSIVVRRFLSKDDEKLLALKVSDRIEASGILNFDNFSEKEVVLEARNIKLISSVKKKEVEDLASFKRVEFHTHTNMSPLDAISSATDYIELAEKWGHKAIAFTDTHGVYSFAEIASACKKKSIKQIYGLETNFVDDINFSITYGDFDIPLDTASYVILDFETTGLSNEFDRITEIGAVKIHKGEKIDEFNTLINPEMAIPAFIQEKTKITPDMVNRAPKLADVIDNFLLFLEGSIIVAQNADFDLGMLYANIKRLGKKQTTYPAIDTMRLAMNFYYNDIKSFNLKTLARFFNIKQESHHRAYDDAKVTADIFIQMLRLLKSKGITNYADINKAINPEELYKYVIPYHVNILIAKQAGLRNLYYILSDSLTNHYHKEPRVLKSLFLNNREGLLIGSGCYNGDVFEAAMNSSYEELCRVISFYDYIEIQPPSGYLHLATEKENGQNIIKTVLNRIIKACKENNVLLIATSNAHYLRPDLKSLREIYIEAPQLGGGIHDLKRYQVRPDQHFRSTDEMLAEMSFLPPDLAFEIVVKNTQLLADKIDAIKVFTKELFAPDDNELADVLGIPSIEAEVKSIVANVTKQTWGDNVPALVANRIDKEMKSIINNRFSANYYMTYLLVKKSNEDGFIVGSRGSVGSSYIATIMGITEVNPLPPHYRCSKCYFSAIKQKDQIDPYFAKELSSVNSGYDLPDNFCPECGAMLLKEGQDIAFETFLGIAGDKIPDIDMNFSSIYQMKAHDYIRYLLGEDKTARAGTIICVADKTAYGYVLGYLRDKGISRHGAEIKRRANFITGVRRSTGQHPGGIIVIPKRKDAYEITPFQYPSDKAENEWQTTHFVYHSIEDNLLKLDILGHDDPTTIRFLFDYVEANPSEFPFTTPEEIPLDDPNVYKFFMGTEVLNIKPEVLLSNVATYGLPEFGTKFVRELLSDTRPSSFAQLVKISGLSHGTNIWLNNGQKLISGQTEFGKIPFDDIIGCRDDIMDYLLENGLQPKTAFEIMEFVRKGKSGKKEDPPKWNELITILRQHNIPEWYIWSCDRIEYMFPKAHAVAYVIMALRIAWFKYYKPIVFYSAFFSVRASQFEVDTMLAGVDAITKRIKELQEITKPTAKEEGLLTMLNLALEMYLRNIKFLKVDINYSNATKFEIEEEGLRLPFITIDGLGESVANDIVAKRNEMAFSSLADIQRRTRINKTVFEKMRALDAFGDIIEEDDDLLGGLFAI